MNELREEIAIKKHPKRKVVGSRMRSPGHVERMDDERCGQIDESGRQKG